MALRILLCANHLGTVPNGPAKFANLLLEQQQLVPNPNVDIRILTPDATPSRFDGPRVYRMRPPGPNLPGTPLREHRRALAYARRAADLRAGEFRFDVLAFNDLTTAYLLPRQRPYRVVGLINDEKNIRPRRGEQPSWAAYLSRLAVEQQQRRAVANVDLVITNSRALLRAVAAGFDLPADRLRVMYKAVRMTNIAYLEPAPPRGTLRVLFVKTDYRIGGLPELYQALNLLKEQPTELTVIGPPPGVAHRLAKHHGAPGPHLQLTMRGRCRQEEVFAQLRQTDVFCVPARQEPLGVANIEAMAHGVPVVTTDAGGIPEVTDGGRNAWVCAPGDPRALVATFREFLAAPEEAAARSRRARAFILTRFSPRAAYERFLALCGGNELS